jgi:hypothetical protein
MTISEINESPSLAGPSIFPFQLNILPISILRYHILTRLSAFPMMFFALYWMALITVHIGTRGGLLEGRGSFHSELQLHETVVGASYLGRMSDLTAVFFLSLALRTEFFDGHDGAV